MNLNNVLIAVKNAYELGKKVQNHSIQGKILENLDSYYQLTRQGQSSIDELSQKIDKLDSKADLITLKTDALIIRDLLAANLSLDDIKATGVWDSSELLQLKNMYRVNTGLPMDGTTCGISNSQIRVMSYFGLFQIGILENADEKLLTRYILHMFATGEPVVRETLFPEFYDAVSQQYISENRRALLFRCYRRNRRINVFAHYNAFINANSLYAVPDMTGSLVHSIRSNAEQLPPEFSQREMRNSVKRIFKEIAKNLLEKGYTEKLTHPYQELDCFYQEKAARLGLNISDKKLDVPWVMFICKMYSIYGGSDLTDNELYRNGNLKKQYNAYLLVNNERFADFGNSHRSKLVLGIWSEITHLLAEQANKGLQCMVEDLLKLLLGDGAEKKVKNYFSGTYGCENYVRWNYYRIICMIVCEAIGVFCMVDMVQHDNILARDAALQEWTNILR